jgi:uncharacterized protein (TIGR00255 family)
MTSSAFREFVIDSLTFFLEIKGYNHRFLEIKINLPDALSFLEKEIITEIKRYVKRGYVVFSLKIHKLPENYSKLNVDLLNNILKELSKITGNSEAIYNWKEVLANPQIFFTENRIFNDDDCKKIMSETKLLIEEFDRYKREEGESLKKAILESLNKMEVLLSNIKREEENWQKEAKLFLEKKLKEFEFNNINEDRLYQELALLLMKTDINEEITRIDEFIRRFYEEIKKDDSIGKTLEFILQEMNREINTLSSKTAKTSIMFYAIDLKKELEKIRELTLNIE